MKTEELVLKINNLGEPLVSDNDELECALGEDIFSQLEELQCKLVNPRREQLGHEYIFKNNFDGKYLVIVYSGDDYEWGIYNCRMVEIYKVEKYEWKELDINN